MVEWFFKSKMAIFQGSMFGKEYICALWFLEQAGQSAFLTDVGMGIWIPHTYIHDRFSVSLWG